MIVAAAEIVTVTETDAPAPTVTAAGTVVTMPATTGLPVAVHVKVELPHVAESVLRSVRVTVFEEPRRIVALVGDATTDGVPRVHPVGAVAVGAGVGVADGRGVGVAEGRGVGVADGRGVGVADGRGVGVADGRGVGVGAGVVPAAAATAFAASTIPAPQPLQPALPNGCAVRAEEGPDLRRRQPRLDREHERHDARHVRRRHARARSTARRWGCRAR